MFLLYSLTSSILYLFWALVICLGLHWSAWGPGSLAEVASAGGERGGGEGGGGGGGRLVWGGQRQAGESSRGKVWGHKQGLVNTTRVDIQQAEM